MAELASNHDALVCRKVTLAWYRMQMELECEWKANDPVHRNVGCKMVVHFETNAYPGMDMLCPVPRPLLGPAGFHILAVLF